MDYRVGKLMTEYFEVPSRTTSDSSSFTGLPVISETQVPISPYTTTWEVVPSPNRLIKKFNFENIEVLKYFVGELLSFEEDIGHHAKIIIEGSQITLEIYTHDLDDVTELDTEYASMADSIFDELGYIVNDNTSVGE